MRLDYSSARRGAARPQKEAGGNRRDNAASRGETVPRTLTAHGGNTVIVVLCATRLFLPAPLRPTNEDDRAQEELSGLIFNSIEMSLYVSLV